MVVSILKTIAQKVPQFTHKAVHSVGLMDKLRPVKETMHRFFKGHGEYLIEHGIPGRPYAIKARVPRGYTGLTANTGDDAADALRIGLEQFHDFSAVKGQAFMKDVRYAERVLGKEGYHQAMMTAGYGKLHTKSKNYQGWFNSLSNEQRSVAINYEKRVREMMDDVFLPLAKGKKVGEFKTGAKMPWADKTIAGGAKGVREGGYVPESISGSYNVMVPKDLSKGGITAENIMSGITNRYGATSYRDAVKYIDQNGLMGKAIIMTQGYVPSTIQSAMKNKKVAEHIRDLMSGNKIYMPKRVGDDIHKIVADEMLKGQKKGALAAIKARLGDEKYAELINRGLREWEIKKIYGQNFEKIRIAREPFSTNTLRRYSNAIAREKDGFKYTPDMMDNYVRSMSKKMFMEKPVKDWNKLMDHPSILNIKGGREYMEGIRDTVLGRPGKSIEWIAKYTKGIGIDERRLIKTFSTVMQAQAALKIGINPLLPLVNATQLWVNTGSLVGFKWVGQAYKFGQTAEGRKLIQEAGYTWKMHGRDVPKILEGIEGMAGSSVMDKINNVVLGPFKMVEMRHNRAYSYLAGYLKAQNMGKTAVEAKAFGKKVVDLTQFPYGSASQPWIMGDPLIKVAGQFKTYMLNQIFFLEKMAGLAIKGVQTGQKELAYPFLKMMGAYTAIGGTSSIPFMKYFETRSAKLNELEMKYMPVSRGLPSLLGVDISRRLGLEFPTTIKELLGPTYKDLWHAGKAVKEFAQYGKVGEHGRRFVGGLSPGAKAIPGLSVVRDKQGWKHVDYRGNMIARFKSHAAAIASQFGFKSTEGYLQSQLYQVHRIYGKRLSNYRRHHINEIVKLKIAGRHSDASAALRIANNPKGGVVPNTPYSPNITSGQINKAFKDTNLSLSKKVSGSRREELRKHLQGSGIMIEGA